MRRHRGGIENRTKARPLEASAQRIGARHAQGLPSVWWKGEEGECALPASRDAVAAVVIEEWVGDGLEQADEEDKAEGGQGRQGDNNLPWPRLHSKQKQLLRSHQGLRRNHREGVEEEGSQETKSVAKGDTEIEAPESKIRP